MTLHLSAVRALALVGAALLAPAFAGGCAVQPVASVDHLGEGGTWTDAGGSGSGSDGATSGSSSGGPHDDAGSCQPGSVQTFQPSAYRPAAAAWLGVCVATAQIDPIELFYDECLGSAASPTRCAEFRQEYAACASCILTSDKADHYGPIIDHGGFVTGNRPGCIELTDPGALSCAESMQALAGCELASCEANCPVIDTGSLSDYLTCASRADATGCNAYEMAAACAGSLADAGPESVCFTLDFKQFYDSVVPLFCAPPPQSILDAGGPEAPGPAGDAGWGGSSDAAPE